MKIIKFFGRSLTACILLFSDRALTVSVHSAWEIPYIEKLEQLRSAELLQLRTLLIIRAGNAAMAICSTIPFRNSKNLLSPVLMPSSQTVPMLSTVVALITYAALGHSQNPAIIFTSLSLFNLVRMPLQLLPSEFHLFFRSCRRQSQPTRHSGAQYYQ